MRTIGIINIFLFYINHGQYNIFDVSDIELCIEKEKGNAFWILKHLLNNSIRTL